MNSQLMFLEKFSNEKIFLKKKFDVWRNIVSQHNSDHHLELIHFEKNERSQVNLEPETLKHFHRSIFKTVFPSKCMLL